VSGANDRSPLGRPYCSACNHDLTGAVDSARCSACGKPLVETLAREGANGLRKPMRRFIAAAISLALVSAALGILLATGAIP
jgi:predicted amidophosphoribosyltransferase